MGLKTFVYIDGFNLYYGAVKATPYKWLDLLAFSKLLVPGHYVEKVKYFTAMVDGRRDPLSPIRQQLYLRALQHHCGPKIEVVHGTFRTDPKSFPLADRPKCHRKSKATRQTICVMKTEEKGSDVNLAVHLINDAWKNLYDQALVISNDSDLIEPIRLIISERGKPVGIANPKPNIYPMLAMRNAASFSATVQPRYLISCQLPDRIPGTTITKPPTW